jgi:hypothetical protein
MFEEKSGMLMWREWRTTVSQRLPEIIVHRECAAEEGRRNDGRKSQRSSLALISGRTGVSLERRLRRRRSVSYDKLLITQHSWP